MNLKAIYQMNSMILLEGLGVLQLLQLPSQSPNNLSNPSNVCNDLLQWDPRILAWGCKWD